MEISEALDITRQEFERCVTEIVLNGERTPVNWKFLRSLVPSDEEIKKLIMKESKNYE